MPKRYSKNGYECDKCKNNFETIDSPCSLIYVVIPGALSAEYQLCPTCSTLFMEKHNAKENFTMKY